MSRFIRILFAVFAVTTLAGYMLGDLVLSSSPDMMTWEEFSSNPRAVASFRDNVAVAGAGSDSAEDIHRAYDRYRESVVKESGGQQGQGHVSQYVTDLKEKLFRVYRAWLPPTAPKWLHGRTFSLAFRERFGAGLTLGFLVAIVLMLSLAIQVCRIKAKA